MFVSDDTYPQYLNFANLGIVIAHEMVHGFEHVGRYEGLFQQFRGLISYENCMNQLYLGFMIKMAISLFGGQMICCQLSKNKQSALSISLQNLLCRWLTKMLTVIIPWQIIFVTMPHCTLAGKRTSYG